MVDLNVDMGLTAAQTGAARPGVGAENVAPNALPGPAPRKGVVACFAVPAHTGGGEDGQKMKKFPAPSLKPVAQEQQLGAAAPAEAEATANPDAADKRDEAPAKEEEEEEVVDAEGEREGTDAEQDKVRMEGAISLGPTGALCFQGSWLFQGATMGKFTYTSEPEDVLEDDKSEAGSPGNPDSAKPPPPSPKPQAADKDGLLCQLNQRRFWSGSFTMMNPAAHPTKRKKKRHVRKTLTIAERFELRLRALPEPGEQPQSEAAAGAQAPEALMHPHPGAGAGALASGHGRNRFGRFLLTGTLNRKNGSMVALKQYAPRRAGDSDFEDDSLLVRRHRKSHRGHFDGGSDDMQSTRASKRARVPNRLLKLDTKQGYAFMARHGNGSGLTPSELAHATGGYNQETLSPRTVDSGCCELCGLFAAEPGHECDGAMASSMRDIHSLLRKPMDEDKAAAIRKTAKRKTAALVRQLLRQQAYIKTHKGPAGSLPASMRASGGTDAAGRRLRAFGQVYEGETMGGQRHGQGLCVFEDGRVYEGAWQNGKMHGKGMLLSACGGLVYQGEFADGAFGGRGTHLFEDGSRYDGEFRDGLFHGYGVFFDHVSGGTYHGDWVRGKRSGHGRMVHADGSFYAGEWAKDTLSGRGELVIHDQCSYEGSFKDNRFEGRGLCQYEKNGAFEGTFRSGLKEGRGTYTFPNGAVYEGRFRQDRLEGFGTLKMRPDHSVKVAEGEWLVPVANQTEVKFIHRAAGFAEDGS